MQALEKERKLPLTGWQQEVDQAKRFGLEAAESIVDRNISTPEVNCRISPASTPS